MVHGEICSHGVFTQIVHVWMSLLVSLVFTESATMGINHDPSRSAVMNYLCSSLPALS